MRQAMAALVLLAALCSIGATPTEERDLTGNYTATGVGTNGGRYEGKATLTLHGNTYLIHWQFGESDYNGVGIRRGDVLSVGWSNHDKAGVVLYTIHGDKLDGEWADGSTDGKIFTETLTLNK